MFDQGLRSSKEKANSASIWLIHSLSQVLAIPETHNLIHTTLVIEVASMLTDLVSKLDGGISIAGYGLYSVAKIETVSSLATELDTKMQMMELFKHEVYR